MKIRLLNNGSYAGLGNVKFPTEPLECEMVNEHLYSVENTTLLAIGADPAIFNTEDECWNFYRTEVEVV